MDIRCWIEVNRGKFDSPYEKMFAESVLAGVDGLDLSTVGTQYQFKDLDNRTRYCDFVIQEGSIRIAIEVDGYDKRNTGQGMSHDDFVDWQRRQAALTAGGWHVLRFANRDVRDHPVRCKRYIELLLRDQRSKSQHQASLEGAISEMGRELKAAQSKAGAADQVETLSRQISLLKNQLLLAQSAQPLSERDRGEMESLVSRLEEENRELKSDKNKLEQHTQVMGGENSTMKTTIWAFTAIIGILVAAGAYVIGGSGSSTSTTDSLASAGMIAPHSVPVAPPVMPQPSAVVPVDKQSFVQEPVVAAQLQQTAAPTPTIAPAAIGQSCDTPIDWRDAKRFAAQTVAVAGLVAEYRYMPKVNGSPTWINLGAKYPDKNRFSVVVWGDNRGSFGRALSGNLVNRRICVIGEVILRDGVAQIAISRPQELVLK